MSATPEQINILKQAWDGAMFRDSETLEVFAASDLIADLAKPEITELPNRRLPTELTEKPIFHSLIDQELQSLSPEAKMQLSKQVSNLLTLHPGTMLQYSPDQIMGIIDEGRAVIITDKDQNEMVAFAQISPWYVSTNEGKVVGATEFRSWLSSKNGAGTQALQAAVVLNEQKYPGISMYAIVEANNDRAHKRLLDAGALEVPRPQAIQIVLQDGEASIKAFDLSNVGKE